MSDASEQLMGDRPTRRRSPARAIARGLGWALIVFVGLIVVFGGLVPRVIGAVPLTVLTGSMEPAYSPGDLVISKPVDAGTLKTGDVITFQPVSDDPALVTHRVVGFEFGNGETRIVTQGDANGARDEPIVPAQVMGRVLYSIPYLGYVSQAIGNVGGAWLLPLLGAGLLVFAGIRLAAIFRRRSHPARADGDRDPGSPRDDRRKDAE